MDFRKLSQRSASERSAPICPDQHPPFGRRCLIAIEREVDAADLFVIDSSHVGAAKHFCTCAACSFEQRFLECRMVERSGDIAFGSGFSSRLT